MPLTVPQAVLDALTDVSMPRRVTTALVSLVQPNMKKLVAYSSVSHLGFVVARFFVLNGFLGFLRWTE